MKSCRYLVLSGKTFQRPGLQSVGVLVLVSGKTLEAMSLELEPPGGTSSTSAQRKRDSDSPHLTPSQKNPGRVFAIDKQRPPPPRPPFFVKRLFLNDFF